MKRRDVLKMVGRGGAGLAAALATTPSPVAAIQPVVRRGLPRLKITDIKLVLTQVGNDHLTNVKVLTSEPGLYGVGCGTHSERQLLVAETIDKFLKPAVVGRYVDEIEDIWQMAWIAPYWRGSVDANNAMSAIDGALWDIMGKRAGMPVYALLGGKVRPAVPMFGNANGRDGKEVEDSVRKQVALGYKHVRINVGGGGPPGAQTPPGDRGRSFPARVPEIVYMNGLIDAFAHLRATVGWDVELSHDVHERVSPSAAMVLAKACEPFRLHFLEDLFAPEDVRWHEHLRKQSSTPIAFGELIVSTNEWVPLVTNRWIDFIRCHISAAGGLTLARKIANCCEFFGVRTAWHGPGNVSPIGHAVNMHLDFSAQNFGIAEGSPFSPQLMELFPGAPERKNGLEYSNDLPGLGVDIDEKVAARYVPTTTGSDRGGRCYDGSPCRP